MLVLWWVLLIYHTNKVTEGRMRIIRALGIRKGGQGIRVLGVGGQGFCGLRDGLGGGSV